MNKKLAAALAQCGFEVTNNAARGGVQGFEMNAAYDALNNSTPLTVHISCYTDYEAKRRICDVFRAEAIKFTKYSFTPYGFELGLNDWTAGRLAERIGALIKFATDTLKANGAAGIDCCPVCGKPLAESASKPYAIGGAQITVHDSCIGDINKLIESENIDFENAPNNYLKGFLGALIGGVAGAALGLGHVVGGDHRQHAGHGLGLAGIHFYYLGVGMAAAQAAAVRTVQRRICG